MTLLVLLARPGVSTRVSSIKASTTPLFDSVIPVGSSGVGTSSAVTVSPAVLIPASAVAGDLAIVLAGSDGDLIPAISWPDGSPGSVGRSESVVGSLAVRSEWRWLAAGDLGASVTCSVSSSLRLVLGVIVFRVAADPVFVNGSYVSNPVSDFSAEHPDVTPSVDNSMLVSLMVADSSPGSARSLSFSSSTNYFEQLDKSSTVSGSPNAAIYISVQSLTGSSGTVQAGNVALESDRISYFPTTVVLPFLDKTPRGAFFPLMS